MTEPIHPPWRDAEGRVLPGAPLLAAHALWLEGAAGAARREDVARDLGCERADFEAVCELHGRLVAAKGERLRLCAGLSCKVEGAAAFHARLKGLLGAIGAPCVFETVHCLDQCLDGPNVRFGDATVCGKTAAVVVDERTWRPPEAGPRAVGAADAPPVRD